MILSQNPVRMALRVNSFLNSLFSVPTLELERICISYRSYNKNHHSGQLTWGTFHRTIRDLAASPKPCEWPIFTSDFWKHNKVQALNETAVHQNYFTKNQLSYHSWKILMAILNVVEIPYSHFSELKTCFKNMHIYADAYFLVFTAEPSLCGTNFRRTEGRHGLVLTGSCSD